MDVLSKLMKIFSPRERHAAEAVRRSLSKAASSRSRSRPLPAASLGKCPNEFGAVHRPASDSFGQLSRPAGRLNRK
jgi:hypothetical protein